MNRTHQRIGRISLQDLTTLAPYRGLEEWFLCPDGMDAFWLKVPAEDEELFQKLPMLGRWTSQEGGSLVRDGKKVPEIMLPQKGWQSLSFHLQIRPPLRGVPGMPPPPITFSLVADCADFPTTALLCRSESFSKWADTAFSARLSFLRFASCDDGRTFVVGQPLPTIPGTAFYQTGNLWLPCGYRLPDHIWSELLEDVLGLGRRRMALFRPDGSHEELDEENLISANRASVRATFERAQPLY